MDKPRFETPDLTDRNIERIAALFPHVITEMKDEKGRLKRGINFELLKQELSGDVVDGEECYDFTWVGKKASIVEANKPIRKTLRPCLEESENWETTGNLYIEGDNLDALKLLQESYLNSIKMIYIDPPYNTGNDFIYRDNFTINREEYEEQISLFDEDDNRLFINTDNNGHFHSDWCSMIYSRLRLARTLLSEDGVIFVSMDDGEIANVRHILDEIFGENNFEGAIKWRRRHNQPNDKSKMVSKVSEYILAYAKNSKFLKEKGAFFGLPIASERLDAYKNPDNDPRGDWATNPWKAAVGRGGSTYTIVAPTGIHHHETWYGSNDTFEQLEREGRVYWTDNGYGYPRIKIYLKDALSGGQAAVDFFTHDKYGSNQEGSAELDALFSRKGMFSNPKPTRLINALVRLATGEGHIILDFFSGSATTAHAIMQLNAEDDGNRKFIMVQLPELTDENSEAYKAGYKNISQIGMERIRRAGEKIKEENKDKEGIENLDIGFRVLKVDSTNMKDVYYSANEYTQQMLTGLESNIKEDRTDLDLLYGVMLDWSLKLSLSHKMEQVEGVTVHTVDEGALVACFAERLSEKVVREIALRKPLRVVFRDSSFANSPDKINVTEIFKLLSPMTTVKVI